MGFKEVKDNVSGKIRRKNFSEREKHALIDCVQRYREIVECQMTNKKSNEKKGEVWQMITEIFNSKASVERDKKSLMNLWRHMKMHARKKHTAYTVKFLNFSDCKLILNCLFYF